MAFTEAEEDPVRARRKLLGKRLGVGGVVLLFGSGLALPFVPSGMELYLVGGLAAATALLVVAYLLVR